MHFVHSHRLRSLLDGGFLHGLVGGPRFRGRAGEENPVVAALRDLKTGGGRSVAVSKKRVDVSVTPGAAGFLYSGSVLVGNYWLGSSH